MTRNELETEEPGSGIRKDMQGGTLKKKKIYRGLAVAAVLLAGLILAFPWWIRLFYPQPYQPIVMAYSENYRLDPLLVYALIRRESRYQEQSESSAGALGLIQILPETALWLAEKEGMEPVLEEELKDPAVNIHLGCAYLAWLEEHFAGNLPVVLAAYNAGHGRVGQWLEDGVWDGRAETIEDIPFEETRRYVNDVLKNYRAYQQIAEI